LIVLRPRVEFEKLVEKWGLPSIKRRWCCFHLKIQPLQDYLRPIHSKVVFDGIRAEESTKRKEFRKIWFYDKRKFKCFCVHPIYYWTENQVEDYIKERNLRVNPVYKILGFSAECFCGAFAHKPEFERLRTYFPEFFDYVYHRGRRIPLRELKKQKTLDI